MTLKRFLKHLANTRAHGVVYRLVTVDRDQTIIRGINYSFYYIPVTAVATQLKGEFFDVARMGHAANALNLRPITARRIYHATFQLPGYNKSLRRRLLRACNISSHLA